MDYEVRRVGAGDWARVRGIRLEALRDPAAPIAFLEPYEEAAARDEASWRERATADGTKAQFVAEDAGGEWWGTVTVLVELPGRRDVFGGLVDTAQAQVVAVYVRPRARGTGVAEALFGAALGWSWALADPPVRRVRLWVHEDNHRAAALYRKAGFAPTGVREPMPTGGAGHEVEMAVSRPRASAAGPPDDRWEGRGTG